MIEPGTWLELRDRFISLTAEHAADPSPVDWQSVWHLLASHPWVKQRLAAIANTVARRSRFPADLKEDLVHDALIILASHLKRTPDLHFDRMRQTECFGAWMNTILTHACQQAARSVRRYYSRIGQIPAGEIAESHCRRRQERVDMSQALDEFPEPSGSVLRLYVKGHTLKGIARLLDLPYWETRQLFHEGEEQLRRAERQC